MISGRLIQSKVTGLSLIICVIIFLYPSSNTFGQNDTNIVDLYGQLQVKGNHIVDQNGKSIALHGMSFFWSQWTDSGQSA